MENDKDLDRAEMFKAVSNLMNNELMQQNITDDELIELLQILVVPMQRTLGEAVKHMLGE